MLKAGGIVLDEAAHMVTIDDKSIDLSFKEFELLSYFMKNEGKGTYKGKHIESGVEL